MQRRPPRLSTSGRDTITNEWTRNSPQLATRTQYFSGDEQDALDRRLLMVGEYGDSFGAVPLSALEAEIERVFP